LVLFLPEASAARAAAEGATLRLIDFDHFRAGNRAERFARAVPLAVVARHVAGIVICHPRLQNFFRLEPPRPDQLRQELGLVHYIVASAEVRILILEIMEAMGALRDDAPGLVAIERLDILRRHGGVEIFV